MEWPQTERELIAEQERLAAATPDPWRLPAGPVAVAGCFVCFGRGKSGIGARGDAGFAAAALVEPGRRPTTAVIAGEAGAPYLPGLLALREGALFEAAVNALPRRPEVLLVNSTGRDHPRRAGLALHLGALLDLPTAGVTHRPLVAAGEWPALRRGERSPLTLDGEPVGYWLVTRDGARPLAVHPAWRTDADLAAEVVLASSTASARTPTPLRDARRAARRARTAAERGTDG